MESSIHIKQASSPEDFTIAKSLILEYVNCLGYDLSFQNFDREIATLPKTYGHPDGALFIAYKDTKPVGVAGIKRFNEQDCELKRMFVQETSRGFGIGNRLMTQCIAMARTLNYQSIKLDTADFMTPAITLYLKHSFREIEAYTHNPHEEARYFELKLP